MRRVSLFVLLAVVLLIALPSAAHAADYWVAVGGHDADNTGTAASPFATVQKAIDSAAASGGGRVYVGPGTFTGTITLKNTVSLYGAGAEWTTLTVATGRVITISGIGAGETISGFTITGGSANNGGGIYCLNSSTVIEKNVIAGNTAIYDEVSWSGSGGGIHLEGGSPTVRDNRIEGNVVTGANGQGAGIGIRNSSVTITGNTIVGNRALSEGARGAGLYMYGGGGTITFNVIEDNVAEGESCYGGGIGVNRASPLIADNTISRNVAGSESSYSLGGGIYASWGAPTITRNWITDNVARGGSAAGGGIAFDAGFDPNAPTISQNVITGNIAEGTSAGTGGGIDMRDGAPKVLGNVISGNTARGAVLGQGAGMNVSAFWEVSKPTIANNVITSNLARADWGPNGGAIYFESSQSSLRNNTIAGNHVQGASPGAGGLSANDFWGLGRPNVRNCIVWANTGAELSGMSATSYSCVDGGAGGEGNVVGDPLFVDSAGGDYRLVLGSPCIDTADTAAAPATDIRGVERPKGTASDMGAYEYAQDVSMPPVAGDDAYTVNEDSVLGVNGRGVLANDTVAPDAGPLVATVAGGPAHGTLEFDTRGLFSYLPDADWSGTDSFEYEVTDEFGLSDTATVTITVVPLPAGPAIDAIEDMTADELVPLAFTTIAADPDLPADTIMFSLGAGAPDGATIDNASGAFSWTPTESQGPDSYTITVVASDGVHLDYEAFVVTVNEVNEAPVLGKIGNKSVDELVELTFTATASDVDLPENALTFSLGTGAPSGASINSATGGFRWTPTEAQGPGVHEIEVVVSDGVTTDAETITVTVAEVNAAPVLGAIGDTTVDELVEYAFTAPATDEDLPANTLTFSLGAGAPNGASINSATGAFSWTPSETQGGSSYPVTIEVSDGVLTDSETFTITVAEVNVAPVLPAIGDKTVDELAELAFTASATDADLPAQALAYSLGAGAPSGAALDPATGAFSWTPTEAQGPGSFEITIAVSDGALMDEETFTVTVAEVNTAPEIDPIGSKSVDEHAPLSFAAVARDVDVPANTLTFSLLPDAPAGAAIDPATGVFSWTPSEAQGPASFHVTVLVTDGTLGDSETFIVTVAEAPSAPVLAPISDKRLQLGARLTFTVQATDADLPAQALVFSLADGAPAGATIDPTTGAFSWTPSDAGSYSITVAVSDGALTHTRTFSVTVSAPVAQETSSEDADDTEAASEDPGTTPAADPSADTPEEESGDDAEEPAAVLETLPATGATVGLQPWLLWALLALVALGVTGWLLRRKAIAPHKA